MKKAKIEIETHIEDEVVTEKYICKFDDSNIEYQDRQKTVTKIKYNENQMILNRSGFVNYELTHDGSSSVESNFKTLVEGEPFEMVLKIENKSYIINKYGKILSIEIQFLREDNNLVKQVFKVEAK
ncbi:hypothetical protein R2F61_09390 [Mollicutes bacterium LVI A0078]|nr:hypothetical protein RZE84_09155 [Mollicutes bacterium LVI A0075]WOO90911.1 hypothetical protein R2F61_09390 [Mollicutes bacterium LVI A0078]